MTDAPPASLVARAQRSAVYRARRLLGLPPPREKAPVYEASDPFPPGHHGPVDSNGHMHTPPNLDALARSAPTRLERLYYGHQGRPLFKWRHYLPLYDRALSPFVGRPVTLVEIGLGRGGSLQLWRSFLGPRARLIGVDIDERCRAFAAPDTEILIGDQGDPDFLRRVGEHAGTPDVVIDDGSHVNEHQVLTMEVLYPRLKDGGVYACEDLHTSYWENYGGGLGRQGTFIEYAKTLIDGMHGRWSGAPVVEGSIAASIQRITIADSIMFFHKGVLRDPQMAWVGPD